MKRILTAVILIPCALFLVFLGPRWQWLFVLAAAAVATLAVWECLDLARRNGFQPGRFAVVAALLALFAGNYEWPDRTAILLGALSLGLLVYCTFRRPPERVLGDAAASIFSLVYVGFTLIALPTLRAQPNGSSLLTFLFCVVWSGDIAALYVGRAVGRHKMTRVLSPNKTWEGAAGSMVASLLVAGGLYWAASAMETWSAPLLSYPDELWYWLVLAALVNVAGQVGDLAESALKRSAGVKDSGNLLPGHGGVLDRIDALMLAAPVMWYAVVIRQMF
ncbi:MAG TPA: phosphatidate cytidylyltransferase [Terracidiphilus sp.]|nr:phosphatidate cytidylyltransferase [Terracidiphilus sp.]